MIWTVYSDDNLIYDPRLDDYKITDAKLELELNKTGSFSFCIYPTHPNYDQIKKLASVITVYKDGARYFTGRVLNDTVGWYNQRQIVCEGELAYLLDSVQVPFVFPASATDTATPEAYLTFLVNRHNEQVPAEHRFIVGNVTVVDPNNYIARSDSEYSTTWQLINEGLLDTLGGYLSVRHVGGVAYLDYLADFTSLSTQPIAFGKNLLGIATERKGEDIATAILPLGKKPDESDERITIATVADEVNKRLGVAQPAPAEETKNESEMCTVNLPVLRKGSKGGYVKTLQILLNKYNGAGLDEDGGFGNLTYNAVLAYQRSRSLDVDGVVGAQTWAQLLK